MKTLLIAPELKFNIDTAPMPIGLLSIATQLKKDNHNVSVYDRTVKKESLNSIYNQYTPDVIGVSIISTHGLKDAIKVSSFFHKKGVKVIWGGIFPSQLPEVFLKSDYIDFISIGEGEKTISELLTALENGLSIDNIKGLAFKDGNGITVNPERPFLEPSEIPVIDYSLININDYTNDYGEEFGRKVFWLSTARGCPFNCKFCYNHIFNHSKVRRRLPEDYIPEIQSLMEDGKIDSVFFADEVWCFSSADMRRRCDEIRATGLSFKWGCFINAGYLNKEDYQYMYDSGCRLIYVGLESGSEEILKQVRKPLDIDKAFEEIKNCVEIGITPFVSFIIGFPGETAEDLKKTADLIKNVSYYGKLFCYFYLPYIGSELYDELLESGKVRQISGLHDFNTKFPFTTLTNTEGRNYSAVPMRDLVTVYSYSLLWSVFNKPKNNSEGTFKTALKETKNLLIRFRLKSLDFSAVVNILYFLYTYAAAVIRVCFHRKVAKKYNLTLK